MAATDFRDVQAARVAGLILLIAAATIAGAWIFQAFGYAPCELCLKERFPYYAGIPVAAATFAFAVHQWRGLTRVGFVLLFLIFAFSAGFGVYHAGVEWRFWPGPTACTGSTMVKATSVAGFSASIADAEGRALRCCGDPHPRPLARGLECSGLNGAGAAVGLGRPEIALNYSVSAANRARARSFSVSLFNWPQAARMSRPRGVRTGLA